MPGKVVDILIKKGDIINARRNFNNIRCNENGKYFKV